MKLAFPWFTGGSGESYFLCC